MSMEHGAWSMNGTVRLPLPSFVTREHPFILHAPFSVPDVTFGRLYGLIRGITTGNKGHNALNTKGSPERDPAIA
jgi:hypothetical protein